MVPTNLEVSFLLLIIFRVHLLFICFIIAMVMADVTVLTDMWKEEEKRVKTFLETLGQKMKDHGVCIRKEITVRHPLIKYH